MEKSMAHHLLSVELTGMLSAWRDGDQLAVNRLTPVVYAELHRIAQRSTADERDGHWLQPTALVNEAFVRLGDALVEWSSRAHFFGFPARLMPQILIAFARSPVAEKPGNRSPHVGHSSVGELQDGHSDPVHLIDLDQALTELAQLDPRGAQVVEVRYCGAVSGISEPTAVRVWRVARACLFGRLRKQNHGSTALPAL
jgi:RNA polymerase sigma factor (TIGR02999 family)